MLLLPVAVLLIPSVVAQQATPDSAGPINVKLAPFLARGDGVSDDTAALQRAIDVAGRPGPTFARNRAGVGRAVYFPAGVYVVLHSLTVQSSREGCDPHCQGGPDCVFNCHPPVSFTGDGLHMSVIKANRTMGAVLVFNSTGQTKPGQPSYLTQSHEVTGLTFDGGLVANHSVFARGIVGSHFRAVGFHNALVSGAALGYGWINDIFECDFHGNGIAGLLCDNNPNSVNIVESNFDENGAGIIVSSGAMVRIEGNCMEGNTGPGIIANNIRSLNIRANYFE